jgi:hypothetical protein
MKLKPVMFRYEVPATESWPIPRFLTVEAQHDTVHNQPMVYVTLSGEEDAVLQKFGNAAAQRLKFNAILNKLPDVGNFRAEVLHLVREHIRSIEPRYIADETPFYSAVHGI